MVRIFPARGLMEDTLTHSKINPSGGTALHVYSIKDDGFVVVLGLLDSGARHNWISRDLVVRLGLCPVKLIEQADFEDFQGGILTAYEYVKLNWYGRSKRTREGCFLVAEKGPFDVLIGSDFLFSAEVFTYNETVLVNVPNPLTTDEEILQAEQEREAAERIARENARIEAARKAEREAEIAKEKAQSSTGTQGGQSSS